MTDWLLAGIFVVLALEWAKNIRSYALAVHSVLKGIKWVRKE